MEYIGCLVVVEGVNGSGKTTIISQLVEYLNESKIAVSTYKFPYRDGYRGKEIDDYLKKQTTEKSMYDVLDMFADNRKSMIGAIKNDLVRGNIVICDRYVFSAIAYHIPLDVKDKEIIKNYCNVIGYFDKDMPVPDMVYLIQGDHLRKRKDSIVELFHSTGDKAQARHRLLSKVIESYSKNFKVLENKLNKSHVVATLMYSQIIRQNPITAFLKKIL